MLPARPGDLENTQARQIAPAGLCVEKSLDPQRSLLAAAIGAGSGSEANEDLRAFSGGRLPPPREVVAGSPLESSQPARYDRTGWLRGVLFSTEVVGISRSGIGGKTEPSTFSRVPGIPSRDQPEPNRPVFCVFRISPLSDQMISPLSTFVAFSTNR